MSLKSVSASKDVIGDPKMNRLNNLHKIEFISDHPVKLLIRIRIAGIILCVTRITQILARNRIINLKSAPRLFSARGKSTSSDARFYKTGAFL